MINNKLIYISSTHQKMECYLQDNLCQSYAISTAKNGLGELMDSECTPRGWHRIHARIGLDAPINSVFVARKWTGEIYSKAVAEQFPGRDWILTRILQLDGLEPGRNQGGKVDSLQRFIYIHGSPDTTPMGITGSRGCVRMHNQDMMQLAVWAEVDTRVFIE